MDEVQAMLVDMGVHLEASFLSEVLALLGKPTASGEERVQFIFSQFLTADLNLCGSGCLLADLHSKHNTVLRGRYVLQIDEATDIAACAKHRWGSFLLIVHGPDKSHVCNGILCLKGFNCMQV